MWFLSVMPEILNPASSAFKSRSERDWIPAYNLPE